MWTKKNEGIHRHDISDEARERIKDLLPGQAGKHGGRISTVQKEAEQQITFGG
ncbi:hypothetical protein [Treponema endosymbiont of Eucomonympha sp.]|uniref:hypothetical protein n=1 Tax=Treponema endosymbiont of Eucomonympha sp. TaxID=1580831 RepID=UPI00164F0B0E|nr:hypothetical protein [Treponema endosymbiont of Eucomonympha sp.]